MSENSGEPAAFDDFDRVVAALNKNGAEYLIIGGYAVIFYGHVRNTASPQSRSMTPGPAGRRAGSAPLRPASSAWMI